MRRVWQKIAKVTLLVPHRFRVLVLESAEQLSRMSTIHSHVCNRPSRLSIWRTVSFSTLRFHCASMQRRALPSPGIGLGVRCDRFVVKPVELLDIKDRRLALGSGPSEMRRISSSVVSDCNLSISRRRPSVKKGATARCSSSSNPQT
jgi:hypothetical protein